MTFSASLKSHRLQLLAVILPLAAIYYLILPDMVLDWWQDENYTHGFLVPFIAGYFLWQRWPELKDREVKPDGWGLAVLAVGVVQLLLGWLATEYFTMRSSLLVLLTGLVLYLFGREILKGMALPLGFCLFMIPIPYLLYNMVAFPLKLFVSKVSVAFMEGIGIVVLREGNVLMFPSTTLEVADACSGMRSLLSLLAVAVAYAFFVQVGRARRCLLIVAAIPIAVATNALRVIGTGVLAQWWGAGAAEGFFHEFAGLVVFALAVLMLLALGAALQRGGRGEARDDAAPDDPSGRGGQAGSLSFGAPARTGAGIGATRFGSVYALLTVAALFINTHSDTAVPANRPFSQFPREVAGWQMVDQAEFSANVLNVLKPTDYISRTYRGRDGAKVSLYVGYHNGGKGTGGIHSPRHCLPGSGWYEVSSREAVLDTPGGRRNLVRAVYQKGGGKELFLYWFQMRGDSITDEYALKWSEIKNSILYHRREQAFVRVSLPCEQDEARARDVGEAFVRDFDPVIKGFLPG